MLCIYINKGWINNYQYACRVLSLLYYINMLCQLTNHPLTTQLVHSFLLIDLFLLNVAFETLLFVEIQLKVWIWFVSLKNITFSYEKTTVCILQESKKSINIIFNCLMQFQWFLSASLHQGISNLISFVSFSLHYILVMRVCSRCWFTKH